MVVRMSTKTHKKNEKFWAEIFCGNLNKKEMKNECAKKFHLGFCNSIFSSCFFVYRTDLLYVSPTPLPAVLSWHEVHIWNKLVMYERKDIDRNQSYCTFFMLIWLSDNFVVLYPVNVDSEPLLTLFFHFWKTFRKNFYCFPKTHNIST